MLKDPPICGLGDVCIHLCGPPGPPPGHWARTASTRAAETCSRGVARAPGSVPGGSHPVAYTRYTPGIHPAYTRRTPGVHPAYTRHTPGVHPANTRSTWRTPGAHPGGAQGLSPGYVCGPRPRSRPQHTLAAPGRHIPGPGTAPEGLGNGQGWPIKRETNGLLRRCVPLGRGGAEVNAVCGDFGCRLPQGQSCATAPWELSAYG